MTRWWRWPSGISARSAGQAPEAGRPDSPAEARTTGQGRPGADHPRPSRRPGRRPTIISPRGCSPISPGAGPRRGCSRRCARSAGWPIRSAPDCTGMTSWACSARPCRDRAQGGQGGAGADRRGASDAAAGLDSANSTGRGSRSGRDRRWRWKPRGVRRRRRRDAAGPRPADRARRAAAKLAALTVDDVRAAGARMLAGRRAVAAIGGAARRMSDACTTIVAEPWADWGLIDCGNGRKYERYGHVTVVRPEPQAMWAPAQRRLGPGRDLRPRQRRGRRRALGPASPGAAQLAAAPRRRPLPRRADALPPPRFLSRHGAAMGLDARRAPPTPRSSTCSATPGSAAWC